jgi:hypothetical protein
MSENQVRFRKSAEILKLKGESEVIDHRLNEIAHEIELLKTENRFDVDRERQSQVLCSNRYGSLFI